MIELRWNAPVSESKIASQINALELKEGQRILDVGCGCGEVLLRICERFAVHCMGFDSSAEHIDEAKRRAAFRTMIGQVEFCEANAQSHPVDPESLDVVMCLGASHAFGLGANAYQNAIKHMIPMVRPGGQLLISEAYAKQPISEGYKQFIGDSTSDDMTHEENVRTGKSFGLIPFGAWTSNEDEWDEFEWTYQRIVERRASASDGDEELAEKLIRRREWMDGYLRWGRDTLGYGTYLFKKPASV